jgi:3-mercaptopyruvate sulfurtransferase SseA
MLAAELVLKNKKAVYDGSWTEWAERQNLKETTS